MTSFQSRYPLSARKYWKKILADVCSSIILCFVGAAPIALIWVSLVLVSAEVAAWTWVAIATLLGLIALDLLARAWYWRVYIRRYFYDASGAFITVRKGVFAPREIHVQWQKIQDVYVDQDFLDRVMGLYDVHIASATMASGMEAHIDGVDEATADNLKKYLLQRLIEPHSPTAQGAASSGPEQGAPTPYQFSEPISSAQYPISGAYILRNIIGVFFASIFFALGIAVWFSAWPAIQEKARNMPIINDPALGLHIALVATAIYFVGHVVAFLMWIRNYRFEFTPEFIYLRTGVISRSQKHVPYRTIQDVSISQSVLDGLFGLANVIIENATADTTPVGVGLGALSSGNKIIIPGQTPANANKICNALKDVVLTKNPPQTGL